MRRAKSISAPTPQCARRWMVLEPIEPRILLATISGNVFEDLDADTVKDASELGLSAWTVYSDADNDGVLDLSSPFVFTKNANAAIADSTTMTSTLAVSGVTGTLASMTVTVNISHTYAADLDVYLISPSGARVELFTDIGIGNQGLGVNVTLDDTAANPIGTVPPADLITGTYRPEGSLNFFAGLSVNGNWKLEITDDQPNDIGTLNSFTLSLVTGERFARTGATGDYTLTNLPSGTHRMRQVVPAGWERTLPVSGAYTVPLQSVASSTSGVNFASRMITGQIGGFVFADYDRDGVRDANEPGQSSWTVYIDTDNDGLLDGNETSVLSAADGSYLFVDVKPGQHVVRQILQAGWAQTAPGSGGVVQLPIGSIPSSASPVDPNPVEPERVASELSIVVAFESGDGMASLRRYRRSPSIAGMFDLNRSHSLFSVQGLSLVSVALPAGADAYKAVSRFSELSGVEWAQPDYLYELDGGDLTPNDPQAAQQYHHALMQNLSAWNTSTGAGVVIAITDDGIDLDHEDLAPNIWTNPGEIAGNGLDDDANGYVDDVNGWDFASNDNNPRPSSGAYHGTHVAGIAAARLNNSKGVAGTAGGAKIMPIRFTDGFSWSSSTVAASFHYAADNGARIVNTSYNIDSFVGDAVFTAGLQYLYDHDVLYLNSAGNSGQLNPARQVFDQGLFVVNTGSTDLKASTSNYGWGVDISAPGQQILSTTPGNTYSTLSGTSMATPNAAAAAALIWSAHPTWTRNQVAAQLLGTADDIDAINPNYAGLLGAGRVNSFRAVTQTIAAPRVRSMGGVPAEGSIGIALPTTLTLDLNDVLDPATVLPGAFELRTDGLDNNFGTADDGIIPITLQTNYRIGTNRLSFALPANLGNEMYRFTAKSTLKDPFGQAIDGNSDSVGGDAYTRTFAIEKAGNPFIMTVAALQITTGNFGSMETTPPQVQSASFEYQSAHVLQIVFSEDVGPSVSAADLVLQRLSGPDIANLQVQVTYDSQTRTATFTMVELPGVALPDGNYIATLKSAGVTDIFGLALDGDHDGVAGVDYQISFFVFAGDADHDRDVDVNDLVALATHYGESGASFSQGDFNYDDIVDAKDLGIMAVRWQQTLAPINSAASTGLPLRSRTPVRLTQNDLRSVIA